MDWGEGLLVGIVALLTASGFVLWRRRYRRPRTPEEALERRQFEAEADHQLDDVIYHADLTNLRNR